MSKESICKIALNHADIVLNKYGTYNKENNSFVRMREPIFFNTHLAQQKLAEEKNELENLKTELRCARGTLVRDSSEINKYDMLISYCDEIIFEYNDKINRIVNSNN